MQGREIWSVFLSVWIWYVSGEGALHNTICQEYSLGGKEELSGVILGLSLHVPKVMEEPVLPAPTLSHIAVQCRACLSVCLYVSVCPESCAQLQGWILGSYRSVSKITHCSEEGWHQQLVELFPPPHRLSFCLSFCLSVFLCRCWHR